MQTLVVAPTATRLIEVCASRTSGPPRWAMDTQQRCDRVRAAITNAEFSLPTGEVTVRVDATGPNLQALDLPIALAVLLADPSHRHLHRVGWIAWGSLALDGSLEPADEVLVNDLPAGACVGRIWEPDDRIPDPDDDAVISLVDVTDLRQAWDVIAFLAEAEEVILGGRADVQRARAASRNGLSRA